MLEKSIRGGRGGGVGSRVKIKCRKVITRVWYSQASAFTRKEGLTSGVEAAYGRSVIPAAVVRRVASDAEVHTKVSK